MTDVSTAPKKKWPKVLGIIVGVIVLIVALAMWATAGVADAAKSFMSTLSSGKVHEAYESTSGMFKQATSEEVFNQFVQSYPILTDVKDVSFSYRAANSDGSGEVSGTITGNDGTVSPVTINLVKENGEWHVINMSLEASDVPKD